MDDTSKLGSAVDKSGFPLQIRLESLVNQTATTHGWRVLLIEHSWKNPQDNRDGFIDIVIESEDKTVLLVVECKRALSSSWIFLNPIVQIHAKCWITLYKGLGDEFHHFDWYDARVSPASPESQYCVVSATKGHAPHVIEQVASELVSATEGLALEEKPLRPSPPFSFRAYFSVIVTTAQLHTCSFSPDQISSDGTVSEATFGKAPYVRFRKQLSTRGSSEEEEPLILLPNLNTLRTLALANEQTVFVVQSDSFLEFLSRFEIDQANLIHGLS